MIKVDFLLVFSFSSDVVASSVFVTFYDINYPCIHAFFVFFPFGSQRWEPLFPFLAAVSDGMSVGKFLAKVASPKLFVNVSS